MKIDLNVEAQSGSSGFATTAMRVDSSKEAKLFHMLSSSLYTNKLRSIIRELCSNAYDSHIMAGCPGRAIKVLAPTLENPVLVVEDNGVGLSNEKAMSTIFCYLGSDKDTSDEFVGGWGIGAKSPFSYTSSYEIKIRFEGVLSVFTCWKDEHGLPKNSMTEQTVTNLPNGVTVCVPIDVEDIDTCHHEIKAYAAFSNYNLELQELEGFERPKTVESIDFSTFTLDIYRRDDDTSFGYDLDGGVLLVYGGYTYENINKTLDDGTLFLEDIYENVISCLNTDKYIFAVVPKTNNSLNFTMSRESMETTEKSKKYLQVVFNELATNLQENYSKSADAFNQYVDDHNIELNSSGMTISHLAKMAEIINGNNVTKRNWVVYKPRMKEHWSSIYGFAKSFSKVVTSSKSNQSAGLYDNEFLTTGAYRALELKRRKGRGYSSLSSHFLKTRLTSRVALSVFSRLEKQICVLYSKTFKCRGNLLFNDINRLTNNGAKTTIFLKAQDEEGARTAAAKLLGLELSDLSDIMVRPITDFVIIDKESRDKTKREQPARVVCQRRDGYLEYYSGNLYVNTSGCSFEFKNEISTYIEWVGKNSKKQHAVVYWVELSDSFTKKWRGKLDNIISADQFMTTHRIELEPSLVQNMPTDLGLVSKLVNINNLISNTFDSPRLKNLSLLDHDACYVNGNGTAANELVSVTGVGGCSNEELTRLVEHTRKTLATFGVTPAFSPQWLEAIDMAHLISTVSVVEEREDKLYKYLDVAAISRDSKIDSTLITNLKKALNI